MKFSKSFISDKSMVIRAILSVGFMGIFIIIIFKLYESKSQSSEDQPRSHQILEEIPDHFNLNNIVMVDLGTVRPNSRLTKMIYVKNTTTEELSIKKISTSCSCAGAVVNSRVVKPGEEFEIELAYRANKQEHNDMRTLDIQFVENDAIACFRIVIKLKVRGEISTMTDRWIENEVYYYDHKSKTVLVGNTTDQNWNQLNVECLVPWLRIASVQKIGKIPPEWADCREVWGVHLEINADPKWVKENNLAKLVFQSESTVEKKIVEFVLISRSRVEFSQKNIVISVNKPINQIFIDVGLNLNNKNEVYSLRLLKTPKFMEIEVKESGVNRWVLKVNISEPLMRMEDLSNTVKITIPIQLINQERTKCYEDSLNVYFSKNAR